MRRVSLGPGGLLLPGFFVRCAASSILRMDLFWDSLLPFWLTLSLCGGLHWAWTWRHRRDVGAGGIGDRERSTTQTKSRLGGHTKLFPCIPARHGGQSPHRERPEL
jgi:hypothetical protein